jgi:hypothetical protein
MVPPDSHKVSPASCYSGFRYANFRFAYRIVTFFDAPFQTSSAHVHHTISRSYNPEWAETHSVWAIPRSLATTRGISFDFYSYRYLDVSVPCVRSLTGDWSSTSRVAPFGNLGITGCLLLPQAYRSLPRPSSPVCAKASATYPSFVS